MNQSTVVRRFKRYPRSFFLAFCLLQSAGYACASQDMTEVRNRAEQGDAGAQYLLGNCYEEGVGVTQDYPQAVAWYRKAAEQGNAKAQSNLGASYEHGYGVTQDYQQAVAWYRKAAEQGEAAAQSNLGLSYASGHGVAQDYPQALAWYRKAAEQGYAVAQYNLGVSYAQGLGVAQDDKQALAWSRKAAEQGYASAQYNLGVSYAQGLGVAQDDKQALAWYRKAAAQGYASAQTNIDAVEARQRASLATDKSTSIAEDFKSYLDVQTHKPGVIAGMCGAYAISASDRPLFFRAYASADAAGGEADIAEFKNMANGVSKEVSDYRAAGDIEAFNYNVEFAKFACKYIKVI
ncbi:tetratricopeptide repeat protein [Pseudomonas arsenicoxydans]|nr:tetratricopeptide repeat protein [Pseudomonas arsenicoxydans]